MNSCRILILLAVSSLAAFSCNPRVPVTRKDATVDTYFGVEVADPYRWLEDDASAETAAWVKAQNKVTSAWFRKVPFRSKLLQRLKEVNDYEKVGVPFKEKDGRWYFFRNDGLQNQSILYRSDTPGGEAEVFLDPNTLSDDGTVALGGIWFSHNGKWMAYGINRSGSDWQEFFVMDLADGKLLDDHIEWAKVSNVAWRGDGFYYSAYDAPEGEGHEYSVKNEGHKIYYHKLGTPQSEDELFFSNPDEPLRFYVLEVNEDETMAFLTEDGADTGNNLYVKDLRRSDSEFVLMTPDMAHYCTPLETDGEKIYLFTNLGAPLNKVVTASLSKPTYRDWTDLIPEGEAVLESAVLVSDKIVLTYLKDASTYAELASTDGTLLGEIALPGVGSASFSGKKGEEGCYYGFSSFTTPGTVYSLNLDDRTSTVFTRPKTAFDTDAFESVRVFYPSADGTMIPLFLTYRKGLELNGNNPVYLYGYGGFDISLTPEFSAMRIPFLEAGGIYAQASIRGGGEYGEAWHLAGTGMNKQNVFDDFIAAAEWLISEGYTCPEKLAIVGGSNGGLLVGACMTQRPDLFAVAVPRVGVMDMLRYHKFTIGWNWAPDYGTSEDSPEMFEYLKGYSPLHNLRPGTNYPATLVTTADHDDRVVPAHSFKFAATLQECTTGERPALIRIDSKAGHGGGKPMTKVIEEQADIYSFIMKNLGMSMNGS